MQIEHENTEFKPLIVAFCCNWCSYAGADLAGTSRLGYPAEVKIIRVPCSCRVNPLFILRAFQKGADGVIICGGGDEVFTQAVDMVRYGIGTVSNVNYYGGTGSIGYPKFSGGRGMAGKTIHMELARGGRARIERMLKMVQYRRVDPGKMVTHRLHGLDKVEAALELMHHKPKDLVKVMVQND